MDLGTVLSVAQTLFAALQCKELKEMCSFLGYKFQLDNLQRTVCTIQAVLRDAETKEELSHQAQLWVQELKDAVYDADDLLDEFVTLAKQQQLIKGGKASKKVRLFFSRHNPLGVAYNISQRVKKIRKNLDAIAKNHADFGFKVDSQSIRRRREETCSYVYEDTIIGREDDVEKILGHMLDDSNVKQDVSFLSIVGIGGLGKTALAQLLFNDGRITSTFSLKLWTCVSDHDQEQLDVVLMLRKILASATGQNHGGSTKEFLQNQLREKLTSKKYLLILDDVWTESRNQWLKLVEFLLGGQRGSWIVVTTRSYETARIVGGGLMHELQGLSKENSWHLFKNIAFGPEQPNPHDDLVEIGKDIIERCARVPLAIRVAGSLLYGQHKSKWLSFKEIGLYKHTGTQKDLISILKLSYHQLESPLKSCFTYCALFSKDTVINKELLLSLWIAHEYVVPLDDCQRIEDAAEEYYSILVRRCFFQDIEFGLCGEIVSCKMHDLIHDVALMVAGKEICMSNIANDDMLKKSRHLAYINHYKLNSSFFSNTHIRSYHHCDPKQTGTEMEKAVLEALLANWMRLRVLDLHNSVIKCLPESIGELLHLRYLDLSENNDLEVLPKSITKLYNLQSLKLSGCWKLKELPRNLRILVNLRILDISGCPCLRNMPEGLSELTYLQVLTLFVIDITSLSQKQLFNKLGELRKLDNLKGELEVKIKVCQNDKDVMEDGGCEGAYLRGKEHLKFLKITTFGSGGDEWNVRLLEELQPHPNLKSLTLNGHSGQLIRVPRWARANNLATSLPNLISLTIQNSNVENLTCLGTLPHLKVLELFGLIDLEYIYEPTTSTPDGLLNTEGFVLFPCLKTLHLWSLPKLKGWRKLRAGVEDGKQLQEDISNMAQVSFPQLMSLAIDSCPELICILLCPNLEELILLEFNRRLQLKTLGKQTGDGKTEASTASSCKISELRIDNVSWLNSFPKEAFQDLMNLHIKFAGVKSLGEVVDVFRGCSLSLKELYIYGCPNLKSVVPGGLEHLMALEVLDIKGCFNLSLSGEEERRDGVSMPRLPLFNSLRSLKLSCAQQLVDLKNWIQFLAALQSLEIYNCKGLDSLPNWMPELSSLTRLELHFCSARLMESCQHTTGQDRPFIERLKVFCTNNYC